MVTTQFVQNFTDFPVAGRNQENTPSDFWHVNEEAVLRPPAGHEYEISVEVFFNANHYVKIGGKPGQVHSHAYRFQAVCFSNTLSVNDHVTVGYEVLRNRMKEVAFAYNNQLLNGLPPFRRLQPTTENLSAILFQQLDRMLEGVPIKLSSVTVWESPTESVTYRRHM
jgi:6-pyruvoyl-tetrahydropterin synthase